MGACNSKNVKFSLETILDMIDKWEDEYKDADAFPAPDKLKKLDKFHKHLHKLDPPELKRT